MTVNVVVVDRSPATVPRARRSPKRPDERLGELDHALASFHGALEGLVLTDSVTTFTASDFGRTLTANGDGTDPDAFGARDLGFLG